MVEGRLVEAERITLPIRLALNWAVRGMRPPDLYAMPYGLATATIRAYDQISGREVDPVGDGDGADEDSGDDESE
jgi:hypothetical protein